MPDYYSLRASSSRKLLRGDDYKIKVVTNGECTPDFTGYTQVQVVLSGVSINTGCHSYAVGGGSFYSYKVTGSINGTYTLAQTAPLSHNYSLTYSSGWPVKIEGYGAAFGFSNTTCDDSDPTFYFGPTDMTLTVTVVVGLTPGIAISVDTNADGYSHANGKIFDKTLAFGTCKCLTIDPLSNFWTAYAENVNGSPQEHAIGSGGTATLTFLP